VPARCSAAWPPDAWDAPLGVCGGAVGHWLSPEPRRGPGRLAARALRERGDLGSEQAVAGGYVDLLQINALDCLAGI
jgi:hypothetical protein